MEYEEIEPVIDPLEETIESEEVTEEETETKKTLISQQTKNLIGSWFRVFVAAVITAVLGTGTPPWNWTPDEAANFLWAGISATLLVIYNYLNPNDTRYGRIAQDKFSEE